MKDIRMLFTFDFIYKWSYTSHYNTAVLGIRQEKNPTLEKYFQASSQSVHSVQGFCTYFHPFTVSSAAPGMVSTDIYNYQGLKLLHSTMLDPVRIIYF